VLASGKVAALAVLAMLAASRLRVAARRSAGSLALAALGGEFAARAMGEGCRRRGLPARDAQLVIFLRSLVIVHSVLVCVAAVDFRKGIDGLARVCREVLSTDPFSGTMFVFRNRRGTAIKVLAYDGQGFWFRQKRLSEGRFRYWPDTRPGRRSGSCSRTSCRCCSRAETRRRRPVLRCGDASERAPRLRRKRGGGDTFGLTFYRLPCSW
jgi:IS66 Orf2 like protein